MISNASLINFVILEPMMSIPKNMVNLFCCMSSFRVPSIDQVSETTYLARFIKEETVGIPCTRTVGT